MMKMSMTKNKKVLHLVLKAKYFHRIYNKTKVTEYRDLTPYWSNRLEGKEFTHIKFQLAYSKNPPTCGRRLIVVFCTCCQSVSGKFQRFLPLPL